MSTSLEFSAKGGEVHVFRRTYIADVDRDHVHTMGVTEAAGVSLALSEAIAEARAQQKTLSAARAKRLADEIASRQAELTRLQSELDSAEVAS